MTPIPPARLSQLAALDAQEVTPRDGYGYIARVPAAPDREAGWRLTPAGVFVAKFSITNPTLPLGDGEQEADRLFPENCNRHRPECSGYPQMADPMANCPCYAFAEACFPDVPSEDEHAETQPTGAGLLQGWLIAVGAGLLGTALVLWGPRVLGWLR